jgi:NAD(P)-dependent dehydrogenase (short-subunit alcohol dehydrogenase family)
MDVCRVGRGSGDGRFVQLLGSEAYQLTVKAIPMGRMGLPKDIANLVVFLASDEADFITGQCIVSDGGYTLP